MGAVCTRDFLPDRILCDITYPLGLIDRGLIDLGLLDRGLIDRKDEKVCGWYSCSIRVRSLLSASGLC